MTTATKNKVCETCGGYGEVRTMEYVWAGEPHMADIGSAPCPECSPPKGREEDREPEDYP